MSSERHLTKESGPERTESVDPDSPKDTRVVSIVTRDSSDGASGMGRRSVGSQTEDSLCCAGPAASSPQSVHTQTEEEDDEDASVESPPVSPPAWGPEPGNQMLFSGSFPIPADPARLAERIRRNRTQLSAAFDDTEYEPYGLPEVVMKGSVVLLPPPSRGMILLLTRPSVAVLQGLQTSPVAPPAPTLWGEVYWGRASCPWTRSSQPRRRRTNTPLQVNTAWGLSLRSKVTAALSGVCLQMFNNLQRPGVLTGPEPHPPHTWI